MKIDEHGNITLTPEEAGNIADFIDNTLDRHWDHHTDHYICEGVSWEDGKRRMNPEMYDFREKMIELSLTVDHG